MAAKKVTYKEPKNYFNEAMKKADRDYDKQQAAAKKQFAPNAACTCEQKLVEQLSALTDEMDKAAAALEADVSATITILRPVQLRKRSNRFLRIIKPSIPELHTER